MNRKSTIIAIVAIALMLAGIAWAVSRLYREDKPRQASANTEYPLLRAVPADAAAVFCFDGSAKAQSVLADSVGVLKAFLAPDDPTLTAFLAKAGESRMLVSLHNSGSLVPLVAAELPSADSTLLAPYEALALKAGLKTAYQDGLLLASRSETLLNSSRRHLDEGLCILEAPGLEDLTGRIGGAAVAFLSARQTSKLLQTWSTARIRQYTDFVRTMADWTAFELAEADDKHLFLKGTSACPDKATSFLTAFRGLKMPAASFGDALPYFADYAISIPVGDVSSYLERYRSFLDAKGKLNPYDKALKDKAGRPVAPEQWAINYGIKEVVRASYQLDGIRQDVVLVRSARDIPSGSNAYSGNLATLFGDYPLRERLSDAGLSLPAGIVAYASATDFPAVLTDLFSPAPAQALSAYVTGSAYAPALAGVDFSTGDPDIRVSLDKRALKGNKVQVLERDTTVVIPKGPFPVLNGETGKTNSFYQNANLYLCLNDENGKGVWGVPFKQPICGYVESIDYYGNGKIQFLFAAGQGLYLLDRLGRFVKDFPADLGKPVLLGPKAYDFTGAHGYTVMVLHQDNSLEMYNLHGQKPAAWKGIQAPETVKALPELLEVKDKKYWVVRTSIRTLVYGFDGGEPLTKDEGGKMIRPDSQITPASRGISVECYDGKTRDIKL